MREKGVLYFGVKDNGCYFGNTDFEIDVFKDRVSIYSPGLFPLGVSPDDFAKKAHEPLVRNPKIINALFITAEMESFGTGFEKTFSVCNEQGVKYHYENSMSGFRFIFYRPHGQKNVHEMSMIEKQIFSLLEEDGTLTFEKISAKIGKSVNPECQMGRCKNIYNRYVPGTFGICRNRETQHSKYRFLWRCKDSTRETTL